MIKKNLALTAAIFFYALILFWFQISGTQPLEMSSTEHRDIKFIPSATFLKIISGDFSPVIADFYCAYGSVLVGNFDQTTSMKDWNYSYHILKLSRDIDPYFKDPYRLVQGIYPWTPKMPEKAISFIKKGIAYRKWDRFLPYYLGFDYYFFLNKYKKAAKYLFMSAKIGHNPFMATLASKIAYKGGDVDTGITFLTKVYNNAKNKSVRKTVMMRINALKGVKLLQQAIDKYKKIYDKEPANLKELITTGIIVKLPENPYKTPYYLKKGQIEF